MPVQVHCDNCNKSFYTMPYKLKELQHGNRHSLCCSRECAYELRRDRPVPARHRRVTLTCEVCRQTFKVKASHAKKRRFCSLDCKAEYQRTAFIGKGNPFYGRRHSKDSRRKISINHFRLYGKDNPNWRGGVTEFKLLIRKSKRYQQWRKAVYRRDGYRSTLSGKKGQELAAHHKKPFIKILREMLALYPDLSLDKDVVQLCEIAMNYAPLWDVDNGITLLRQEHIKLHSAYSSQGNEN